MNLAAFDAFPELKTSRLHMRDIRLQDAQAILEMRANGRVNAFIARPALAQLEDAEALVTKTRNAFEQRLAIGWAGLLRDGDTIIGTCGLHSMELHNHYAELGGEMATAYWGKGIAQEAVEAILEFGMNRMGLHTIGAKIHPGNRGAVYLLEHFGFVKEAHFRDRIHFEGKYLDMAVYTLHAK